MHVRDCANCQIERQEGFDLTREDKVNILTAYFCILLPRCDKTEGEKSIREYPLQHLQCYVQCSLTESEAAFRGMMSLSPDMSIENITNICTIRIYLMHTVTEGNTTS